jgi:chaperone modulatory protein CbpM
MTQSKLSVLSGQIFEEHATLSLDELSGRCAAERQRIVELVEEGVLATQSDTMEWHFSAAALRRARVALHLQQDLGLNAPGAALALELLEEIEQLRRQLQRLR